MVNGIPPLQPEANIGQPPSQTDPIGDMFNPQGSKAGPVTVPLNATTRSPSPQQNPNQPHQFDQYPALQQSQPPEQQRVFFADKTNHTNKYEMESLFVHQILGGDWFSYNGEAIPPCSVEEAWGLAQTVVENLLKAAATKEAFLINLAALAGGKLLMPANGLKVTRLEAEPGQTRYSCDWQLQYGDICGSFSMKETVLDEKWKKGVSAPVAVAPMNTASPNHKRKREGLNGSIPEEGNARGGDAAGGGNNIATMNGRNSNPGSTVAATSVTADESESQQDEAATWKRRYKEMAKILHQRDQELERLRSMIVGALKDSRQPAPLPVDG